MGGPNEYKVLFSFFSFFFSIVLFLSLLEGFSEKREKNSLFFSFFPFCFLLSLLLFLSSSLTLSLAFFSFFLLLSPSLSLPFFFLRDAI